MTEEESSIYINYANGINKVVENIKVYPMEFHVLMTSFEPWTIRDSVSIEYFSNAMISTDWFAEMLRLRLLEVYDRDLVDQILPYKPEHMFPFKQQAETISDDELAKIDKLEKDASPGLYEIEESLIYKPPRVNKVEAVAER